MSMEQLLLVLCFWHAIFGIMADTTRVESKSHLVCSLTLSSMEDCWRKGCTGSCLVDAWKCVKELWVCPVKINYPLTSMLCRRHRKASLMWELMYSWEMIKACVGKARWHLDELLMGNHFVPDTIFSIRLCTDFVPEEPVDTEVHTRG